MIAALDKFAVFTAKEAISDAYFDGLPRAVIAKYSGLEGDTALSAGYDVVQSKCMGLVVSSPRRILVLAIARATRFY